MFGCYVLEAHSFLMGDSTARERMWKVEEVGTNWRSRGAGNYNQDRVYEKRIYYS